MNALKTMVLLACLGAGTIPAAAHEEGWPMHRMRGMHGMHKMGFGHALLSQAEALVLSDEQMGKIARIELRNQKKRHEIMERMHQGMRAIHDGLMDPSADTASLRRLAQEHARVHQDMIEDKIKAREEVLAVLSTEQRGKLAALLKRPGPGAPHWWHPPPSPRP